MGRETREGRRGRNRKKNERKNEERKKRRKEGRKEEHALCGRASSILRNSDIALYSANPPPSYGPLDRHALPRNHGKTGGRKKMEMEME